MSVEMQVLLILACIGLAGLSGGMAMSMRRMRAELAQVRVELDREKAAGVQLRGRVDMAFELLQSRLNCPLNASMHPVDDATVGLAIANTYTNDEMDVLATRIGLNMDSVGGEALEQRAIRLVRAARARGRINDLVNVVRAERPMAGL